MGQIDSAWHYMEKGQQLQLVFQKETLRDKVIAIDAKYDDEKRVTQIEQQKQQIQFEQDRKSREVSTLFLACLE